MITVRDSVNGLDDLAREALGSAGLTNGQFSVQPYSKTQFAADNGGGTTSYYGFSTDGYGMPSTAPSVNSVYYGYLSVSAFMQSFTAGSFQLVGFQGNQRADGSVIETIFPFGTQGGAAVAGGVNLNFSFCSPRPVVFSYIRILIAPAAGNWTFNFAASFSGFRFIGT